MTDELVIRKERCGTGLAICVHCKHYRLDRVSPAGSQHRCNRPLPDLVTGESKPHDAPCSQERVGMSAPFGVCGVDARFWEPRA